MTDQSDRQDGDGLRARLEEERNDLDNSFGRGSWADGLTRDRIRLIDEKLAALPLPTRDGAEGAAQESTSAAVRAHATPRSPASAAMGHCAEVDTAAPPKPAPDAMRDSIVEIDGCFEAALVEGWIDAIESGDIERIRDLWYRRLSCAALEARSALSAAPVPPPDGADEDFGDMPSAYLAARKIAPSPAVAAEPEVSNTEFVFGPFSKPPKAAEPVAWRWRFKDVIENNPWRYVTSKHGISTITTELVPLYASPTVRGEREAIARIIGGNIFGSPDSEVGPATVSARKAALTKADAILSLRVQPAGERECISFPRWWIQHIRDGLFAMDKLPSGPLGDWAFLFREQLNDALSRQAQHSSSETDICPYCDSEMEKDACSACGRERVPPEGYTTKSQ